MSSSESEAEDVLDTEDGVGEETSSPENEALRDVSNTVDEGIDSTIVAEITGELLSSADGSEHNSTKRTLPKCIFIVHC